MICRCPTTRCSMCPSSGWPAAIVSFCRSRPTIPSSTRRTRRPFWKTCKPPASGPSSPRRRVMAHRSLLLLCLVAFSSCHTDMYDQPKIEPLEESAFFSDGMGARPIVPGTVFRGQVIGQPAYTTGRNGAEFVDEPPVELNRKLLQRGRERFDIFCSNCHGRTGDG